MGKFEKTINKTMKSAMKVQQTTSQDTIFYLENEQMKD